MDTINWSAIRAKFPVCGRLVYLNAAGGSPMCVHASVEGKRYFDEMLLHGDTCWEEWLDRTNKVRNKLAGFLGAGKDEIAFVPNTSTGMGMIARILRNTGRILTMEDEFPSSTIPWLNQGYQIDFIRPENGIYSLEHIAQSIRPCHKILLTSYVQYKTGFRQQIRELGKLCRSSDLHYVVNATQAMGVFPIDVVQDNIDFLVFSGLKWACAGYGTSAIYVRKELFERNNIPFAGWRSVRSPEIMDNRSTDFKPEVLALEAGSPSFPAIFALGGALDLFESVGRQPCMDRVLYLSRRLENRLMAEQLPVIPVPADEYRSGIVMLKTTDGPSLVKELYRQNIVVSARGEGLRISVNIFNNEEDIEKLIIALLEINHRFHHPIL